MRKTLATIVIALGLVFAAAPMASANTPTAPSCIPGNGVDAPITWASAEASCGVSVTGDARLFVTFLEDMVETYQDAIQALMFRVDALKTTVADQQTTIDTQQATIARQSATIKRLRAKLSRTH